MKVSKKLFLFVSIYIVIASTLIYNTNTFGYSLLAGITVYESDQGVSILEIKSGFPAKNAGIKKGDIILEIDRKKIRRMSDYVNYSRALKNEKHEVHVRIKRKERIFSFLIEDYSIPIKEFWNEKAPYSREKIPRNEVPFEYWIDQGEKKLDSLKDNAPYQKKIEIYQKAIENIYYALHYNPKKIMAMVLIADTYKKIGETLIKNGLKEEAMENFRNSVRLYKKAMVKTNIPKERLIEIRENLKTIESLLKQNLG